MIDKLKLKHPVQMLCNQLDVAISGYSAYGNGKSASPRILAAHARGRGIYGPLKIQSELKTVGIQVGVNRIKRLRKLANIKCIHKRKFRVTTDSKHKLPIAPNLLNRQFNQPAPNKVWLADITYIPTNETVKVFPVEYSR